MEKKIMVEINLDGPRMLQRPRPVSWDLWIDGERERFIGEMEQELIDSSVAFTVHGDEPT